MSPLSAGATVLAFGDSLTYGTGAKHETTSYPAVLAGLIGRKVVNVGLPGEVSADGLNRLPDLLDEHNPKLMILCHGGNDMLRKRDLNLAKNNLREMVLLAKAAGAEEPPVSIRLVTFALSAIARYCEKRRTCTRVAGDGLSLEPPVWE